MKEHIAPIYGGQNIHTSAVMHKFQSDIAIDKHIQIISNQVESSLIWNNNLPMAEHVTELAYDICHNNRILSKDQILVSCSHMTCHQQNLHCISIYIFY